MAFTQIRDVDLKIFSELDDISLLRVYSVNRNVRNHVCKDENFWRNRFFSKYGDVATIVVKYKPENRTWKDYYLQVLIDLDRYAKNPMEFSKNIVWNKDIEHSYYVPEGLFDKSQIKDLIPLSDAPEWVLNNLYLLDLGNEIILADQPLYSRTIFNNPKPIQIFQFISDKFKELRKPIRGFNLREGGYRPLNVVLQ